MALSDEQRTMLQLLLEGGQSYDDIGSLLGVSPDEVRNRARSALQEIGGADPDAQVGLSDYLLGQADPIGRADAVRQLQSDPEANALAQRLVQNLRLLAPNAQLPEIPEPRGGRRAAVPPPPPAAPQAPPPAPSAPSAPPSPGAPAPAKGPGFASRVAGAFSGLGGLSGKRRTQFLVGLAAALALVIVVIVVVSGGGGSDDGSDCKPLDVSAVQQAGIPSVKLSAVGAAADADCPPTAQITLLPVPQNQQAQNNQQVPGFALQTNAAHLQPTSDGEQYVLWLVRSDDQARPLGKETVGGDGNLNGAAPLSTPQLLYLQALPTIRMSRVSQPEAQQIDQALQAQQGNKKATGLVQFAGTPVLEGSSTTLLQQLQQTIQQLQQQAGAANQGAGKKG